MALLTVEGAIDDVTGVGQRGGELPIEIGIVLDNEKAQSSAPLKKLRSKPADERAFRGVDGQSRHFAIVRQNCQHVDQTIMAAAKPRPNQGAGHPAFGGVHGGGEMDHPAGFDFGLALLLIETGASGLSAGMRRVTKLLGTRGCERKDGK
jgi:hypothetical protein